MAGKVKTMNEEGRRKPGLGRRRKREKRLPSALEINQRNRGAGEEGIEEQGTGGREGRLRKNFLLKSAKSGATSRRIGGVWERVRTVHRRKTFFTAKLQGGGAKGMFCLRSRGQKRMQKQASVTGPNGLSERLRPQVLRAKERGRDEGGGKGGKGRRRPSDP